MRPIWLVLGFVALGFAILGLFLPLLPTVPFLLLSAFFFAESSEKVHKWLLEHRVFGEIIRDWHERGAITLKSKYMATISMALALIISFVFDMGTFVITVQAIVLTLVLLFIWTRPSQ